MVVLLFIYLFLFCLFGWLVLVVWWLLCFIDGCLAVAAVCSLLLARGVCVENVRKNATGIDFSNFLANARRYSLFCLYHEVSMMTFAHRRWRQKHLQNLLMIQIFLHSFCSIYCTK